MQRFWGSVLAGYAVAVCVVLGLAAVSWNFAQRTSQAHAFVSHTHQVLSNVAAAEAALWRAESAQRAFLLSRQPGFLAERDEALAHAREQLFRTRDLTQDNATQQQRLGQLEVLLQARIEVYRQTQELATQGAALDLDGRLRAGLQVMQRIEPVFAQITAEERRLLAQRQEQEHRQLRAGQAVFGGLVLAILASVPVVLWSLRREWRARRVAEHAAEAERAYATSQARALTLFNSAESARDAVRGAMEVLAAQAPFFAAAMCERTGTQAWQVQAVHALPAALAGITLPDAGLGGQVAREGRAAATQQPDALGAPTLSAALRADGAAEVLVCPVRRHDCPFGLLLLAATRALTPRERDFAEQLSVQLGIALHALRQFEEAARLAAQLNAQSAQLQRTNDVLQAADRSKSEFLANMSHELRTPLNAVIGFADVLADGVVGELSEEQRDLVGEIAASGKHLLSLINDVLDIAKVEAGQMALELEPMHPAELATSGLSMLRERALQRRVRLDAQVQDGLDAVAADARKARQILFNLLSNAVKFTPEGGQVTLQVTRVERQDVEQAVPDEHTRVIAPAHVGHAHWLQMAVRDSGIGIARADLDRLFQPFMQIDSALGRLYPGTGLGLSLVLKLTQLHGGGLRVRSLPQQGSEFTVWLPWRQAGEEAPAPVAAAPSPEAESGSMLVLVIDDDPQAVNLVRLQLQAQGWQVAQAGNAAQGLSLAARLQPQAILLDLLLPDADGWSVLARLKADTATRDIPVVICSIVAQAQRGFALGAAQVLTKPVSQQQLLDALGAAGLQAPRPGARVLVVDDDPATLAQLCDLLRAAGLHAVPASNGQAALQAIAEQAPALILLELALQGVTGFDVVHALSGRPQTADIPIVLLATPLDAPQARELLGHQVQRVVQKSDFTAELLQVELRRALAHRPPKRTPPGAAPTPPDAAP